MKTKLTTLLLALCAIALTGCEDNRQSNQLYRGRQWDIVRLNDSIVVCAPVLNADSKMVPVVINLHDPDCPCHNKQSEE